MKSPLTGRFRYRVSRFRKRLILQVEEKRTHIDHAFDTYDYTVWRDAKVTDMVIDINGINLIQ